MFISHYRRNYLISEWLPLTSRHHCLLFISPLYDSQSAGLPLIWDGTSPPLDIMSGFTVVRWRYSYQGESRWALFYINQFKSYTVTFRQLSVHFLMSCFIWPQTATFIFVTAIVFFSTFNKGIFKVGPLGSQPCADAPDLNQKVSCINDVI